MRNIYWDGNKHVVLKREDVSASWIKKDTTGVGLLAVNKAFCLWYHGRQIVKKNQAEYVDSLGSNKIVPLDFSVSESLDYCGDSGFGRGVRDLDDVFKHLIKNNGKWTDENASWSYNGRGRSIGAGVIPTSIVNFLKAVDATRPNINKAVREYNQLTQKLSNLKITGDAPVTELNTANKIIKAIGKSAQTIKRYSWLIPAEKKGIVHKNITISGINTMGDANRALSSGVAKGISYAGTVFKILDLVETYEKSYRAFNGDRRMALCFATLSYAVNLIPVLGAFYGEYFKHIGSITSMGYRLRKDKNRQLNAYTYQLQQSRRSQSTARCINCNSAFSYNL